MTQRSKERLFVAALVVASSVVGIAMTFSVGLAP